LLAEDRVEWSVFLLKKEKKGDRRKKGKRFNFRVLARV